MKQTFIWDLLGSWQSVECRLYPGRYDWNIGLDMTTVGQTWCICWHQMS